MTDTVQAAGGAKWLVPEIPNSWWTDGVGGFGGGSVRTLNCSPRAWLGRGGAEDPEMCNGAGPHTRLIAHLDARPMKSDDALSSNGLIESYNLTASLLWVLGVLLLRRVVKGP